MSITDPLIVPVEVAAMVLNDPAMNILRAEMDYAQLAVSESPDPGPFSSDEVNFAADPHNQGIYVLWTLPKGLRRQRRHADGTTTDFPFAPNRWLAVRLFQPAGAAPTAPAQVTSWVLQSDAIDNATGGAAYIDPTQPTTLTPTRIGTKTAITTAAPWQEPVNPPAPFLKAVAESNPAFAAFQPFNENVFSFFDNLQIQGVGAGTASYYVVGWYSDASADALADWTEQVAATAGVEPGTFAAALADLGWTVDQTSGQSTHTSVYEGSAFAVPWVPGGPQPPSPKDGVNPSIAIGQTSMDAVVAFTRAAFEEDPHPPKDLTPQQAADLIAAFEYSLLPMLGKPGAEAMLESQIRTHWFSSSQSGASWTIVNADQKQDTAPTTPSAEELAAEAVWLGPLNAAQTDLDDRSRELLGVQRQLFSLWWKQGAATVYYEQSGWASYPWGITGPDEFTTAITALVAQAQGLLTTIAALQAQIPTGVGAAGLSAAIAAFAKAEGLPDTRVLKQVPASRFWAPVDPVAVISHTEHLMHLDPGGTLACRWPTALVTSIEIAPGSGITPFIVDASQAQAILPAVPFENLPTVCAALIAELFLLDPLNAGQLSAAAGHALTSADLPTAAQSMSPPQVPAGSGAAPALLAAFPWSQPWRPLYFDWSVEWFPVPFTSSDGSANWAFDGLDYDLVPGRTFTPQNQQLEGRTFLTPKPSFEFKARIDQFIHDYPESPITKELRALEDVVATVDAWDFLSQSLSGLGTQLAGWNPVPTSTPGSGAAGVGTVLGDQGGLPPMSLMADPQRVGPPPSTFEGMRGGQLYVERVTIVDAFGQTLEIVEAPIPPDTFPRTTGGAVFLPLIADGLTPTKPLSNSEPLRFVQLPPRVLQPARLNVDFLTAGSDTAVLGWLLPDHPDSSIAVYGPDGTAYGALRLGVDLTGARDTAWEADPNSPWPTLPPPSPSLDDLQNVLATLQSKGPGALSDFLQSVDESLWTVDPLGARSDAFLSILIGRPLAVVSAAVSLELEADPWRDQAWPYTFNDPLPRFLGYEFEVRLGDLGYRQDGLIGYFAEGAWGQFNCIHEPQGVAGDSSSGYLKPIGPGNYVNVGFGATGPSPAAKLTLLMDPRAGVHSQCALVPVQQTTLPASWVDPALANMAATFRVGPALVAQQTVTPAAQGAPTTAVVIPRFAESRGTLTWVERTAAGGWTEKAIVPADATADLPATPPTLREGLLKLTGGIDA